MSQCLIAKITVTTFIDIRMCECWTLDLILSSLCGNLSTKTVFTQIDSALARMVFALE